MTTTESKAKKFLSLTAYPAVLVGAVCATHLLQLVSGLPIVLSGALVVVLVGVSLWALERKVPYLNAWRPSGRCLRLDILHTIVSSTITPLLKMGMLFLLAMLVHPHVGLGLWPTEWPIAWQVALAIPAADFGIYLGHRVMHVTNIGWRVHAIHHSPRKLHFWAAARSHPFNVVVKVVAESGVILLLGIQPEVYALWLVFMSVNGLLQHANVDLRPGALSYVLATNVVHRVHHDVDMDRGNSNFGNTTVIWDHLFGTFQLPAEATTVVGIADCDIPENYGAHLLTPFVLGRFEAPSGAQTPKGPVPVE